MDILDQVNSHWGWTGLRATELVGRNAFGNLILVDHRGRHWRICPEELTCEVVAETKADFLQLSADEDFQLDWEMSRLVEMARDANGKLETGQVYYLVFPSILGGVYEASNMNIITLAELISVSASLALQIRDLPDGARIKLEVVD